MDKFHSLFLSSNGSVYSCGFGIGGRLGHDNEEPVLIPKQIAALESSKEKEDDPCIDIVATRDCSFFLTRNGFLWSCGLNNYHQLGHPGTTKVLTPTKVQFRQLKERKITKIACGRFHTALIVDDGQMFTFGLNAGQLGHLKSGDLYIQQPLQVTKFNSETEFVQELVSSDQAIVCYTNRGDIYVLSDYRYRKIIKHTLNITQLIVLGGKLDSISVLEEENVDEELKIFYLQSKKLYLYHEREISNNNRSKLCLWNNKQRFSIESIAAGSSGIVFVTDLGQAYTASLDKLNSIPKKIDQDANSHQSSIYDERAYQYFSPSPIPLLHRCRSITTDRTGRSLAALQYHPNTCLTSYPPQPSSNFQQDLVNLLDGAEHTFDITLKINNFQTFPAHKYILSTRSPYFRDRITKDLSELSIESESNSFIDPDLFVIIIEYIYSDKCPWLNLSEKIRKRNEEDFQVYLSRMKSNNDDDDIDDHRFFARAREQASIRSKNEATQKSSKSKKKKKNGTKASKEQTLDGPETSEDELVNGLENLINLSKIFQLQSLRQRLETVRQSRQTNGSLSNVSVGRIRPSFNFSRKALSHLHDVTIIAEDGISISCHKSILISRLEYFRHMFLADWIESQSNSELKMAIPSDLLEILIDYLYTDKISLNFKVEQVCQILVLADQLLIEHLKEICEMQIANLVTFRDASELLEFGSTYNAEKLKSFVSEFICRNLATFLESRLLDNLDESFLVDLSRFYRNFLDAMNYRRITPYENCPSLEQFSVEPTETEFDEQISSSLKKSTSQQKRKQNKTKISPTKSIDEPVSPVSPSNETKKRDEPEKWKSVPSKKNSKNKFRQNVSSTQEDPTRPVIPGAVYSQQQAEKFEAAKKNLEKNPSTTVSLADLVGRSNVATTTEYLPKKNPWKVVPPPVPFQSVTVEENVPSSSAVSIAINDNVKTWSTFSTSPPPISFKNIQDQETRAHQALKQVTNKSLQRIQTEELAIQALHRLYNTENQFDVFITIERVTPEIANPIWPRSISNSASNKKLK